ncbi:MAG: AAA family ATPase [Desulfobulbaceae bacterium]|nr:AAA family ATPase [Desulfobulbaceae bacterium]
MKRENESLLNRLKEIWLEQLRDNHDLSEPTTGADELLKSDGTIGRFITCTEGFKQELRALEQTVNTYVKREKPSRPLNLLLAANPGSGKSFLVKELSKQISGDTEFLEYHVASFRKLDDLFSIFQRIQSLNLEGKLPFVLLDEVDGKVAGDYIFPNLLAPLWDGVFHIGQDRHHLGRAVLFFAASALLSSPSTQNVLGTIDEKVTYLDFADKWRRKVEAELRESEIPKARDFIDRIDLLLCIPPIDFAISDGDPAQEYTLIACILVKKHFPSVTRIEKPVIWILIMELINSGSRRRAESTVFRSTDPQGSTFDLTHLPPDIVELFKDDEVVRVTQTRYISLP